LYKKQPANGDKKKKKGLSVKMKDAASKSYEIIKKGVRIVIGILK
jgi:hypothetical protein